MWHTREIEKVISSILFSVILFISPITHSLAKTQLGNVKIFHDLGRGIEIDCDNALLSLEIITHEIIRVRLGIDGKYLEDYSYAIKDDLTPKKIDYKVKDLGENIILSTHALDIVISKNPTILSFMDKNGNSLCKDFSPISWEAAPEGFSVTCTKELAYGQHFYGLGEKTGPLDKRNCSYEMWNTDAFGYNVSTDPIYQSNPFLIALKTQDNAYGVFSDNTYRTHFNMKYSSNECYLFKTDGGEMDYYFIAGPLIKDIVRRYAYLTGTIPMPPLWALGHMISKLSFFPYEETVKVAKRAREERIPLDALWFDLYYMDNYKNFTWDTNRLPDFKGLISSLHSMGHKIVGIINPSIKVDLNYFVYTSGLEKDVFVKYPDGKLYMGRVWPGTSVFPDFTRTDVREWWGN